MSRGPLPADEWIDDPQFWLDFLTAWASVGYVLGMLIGMVIG